MFRVVIRKVILMTFLLVLSACAQGTDRMYAPFADAAVAEVAVHAPPAPAAAPGHALFPVYGGGQLSQEIQAPAQRLIVQSASVQLETEDFDDAVAALRNIPGVFGGYTRSETLFTVFRQQQFEIVIRVPAAYFETALWQIEQIATSRSLNISAEDVTDHFYDMTGRLETRLIEEERILALIDQTDRLSDLLELESRLAATRLQIDRYRTSLADLASRITYSTIHVHLFDVEEAVEVITAASFGERIGGAFGKSIDGTIRVVQFVIVVLAGAVIPLAIISPFIIIVFVLRSRKKAALAESE